MASKEIDLSRCKAIVVYVSEEGTCATIQAAGWVLDGDAWVKFAPDSGTWRPSPDELRGVLAEGWEIIEAWNRDIFLAQDTRGFWRRLWLR